MAPTDDLANPVHWLIGGCTALVAISAWLCRRAIKRMDDDIAGCQQSIEELKEDRITRQDFDELRGSMTASITTAFQMIDKSVERRHAENRQDRESLLAGVRAEIDSIRADVRAMWNHKP